MEPFIGMIAVFGFTYAPEGWQFAQGQTMPLQQYQALYALISNIYGPATTTTFTLPDLRGRTVIGYGVYQSTNYHCGNTGGAMSVTLSAAQLPLHNHTATFTPAGGGSAAAVQVSPKTGERNVPQAGDYLSAPPNVGMTPVKVYGNSSDPGTTVALGGVSGGGGGGGTVTVGNAGSASAAVNVMQPYMVMNTCIAMTGLWPSRD